MTIEMISATQMAQEAGTRLALLLGIGSEVLAKRRWIKLTSQIARLDAMAASMVPADADQPADLAPDLAAAQITIDRAMLAGALTVLEYRFPKLGKSPDPATAAASDPAMKPIRTSPAATTIAASAAISATP